jgi:hypothetical protein
MNIARNIPILVAFFATFYCNYPLAIEIKMMLSIPKTISRKVNVNKRSKHQDLKILPFSFIISDYSRV